MLTSSLHFSKTSQLVASFRVYKNPYSNFYAHHFACFIIFIPTFANSFAFWVCQSWPQETGFSILVEPSGCWNNNYL